MHICLRTESFVCKKFSDHIADLTSCKFQLWLELAVASDESVSDVMITEYHQKVFDLWDALMGLELQLVDQLEVSGKLSSFEI